MRVAIRVPEVATLVRWCKRVGERVEVGDVVAEVETDKAIAEIEAIGSGVLAEIAADVGTANLDPEQPIGWIDAAVPAPSPQEATVSDSGASPHDSNPAGAEVASDVSRSDGDTVGNTSVRRRASPLARRLAAERGIELEPIVGGGPGGRIRARDVMAFGDRHRGVDAPRQTGQEDISFADMREHYKPGSYEIVATSGMRRAIARRVTAAMRVVPQFHLSADLDVGALRAIRPTSGTQPDEDGVATHLKISLNDFFVKAVALTLQQHPGANAIWAGDELLLPRGVDVGLAVAVEGGLVTPVLRDVQSLSLADIAKGTARLTASARAHRLSQADLRGGTTSVSNLGMYGVERFAAIINPPQATMFAIGAIRQAAVVRDGIVQAAWIVSVTLTCDHRVVDGVLAARVLSTFRESIEQPTQLELPP